MSASSSLHPRLIGFLCLGVTATGWAMNWPIIKILLRDWPPLFARGVAGTAAGLILAGIAIGCGESLRVPRHAIPRLLFAAFTNVFAWMGCATVALKMLSIGEGALLVYTMPIWATLFAWPILGHRPGLREAIALMLGTAGIVVLMGEHGFALSQDKLVGVALTLSAATLFALGSVLMADTIADTTHCAGCMASRAWLLPDDNSGSDVRAAGCRRPHPNGLGCSNLHDARPDGRLLPHLVRHPPPSATLDGRNGELVVPVLGVISAAIVLGEPLGLREVVAMALTLGGVTLALRKTTAA